MNPAMIAGLFGLASGIGTNVASAKQADNQMQFQERMSNTQIQRRMADLRAGGLNPILAGKHEASSPGGAMAQMKDPATSALAARRQSQELKNMAATELHTNAQVQLTAAQINKVKEETDKIKYGQAAGVVGTDLMSYILDALGIVHDGSNTSQMESSSKQIQAMTSGRPLNLKVTNSAKSYDANKPKQKRKSIKPYGRKNR